MLRNVDVKFERFWFGNAFAGIWVPHLATHVLLPNWSDCQFGGNQAPITHPRIMLAAQPFVSGKLGSCSCRSCQYIVH